MDINLKSIEALADLANTKKLAELTLEQDNQKLSIKTAYSVPQSISAPAYTSSPENNSILPTATEAQSPPSVTPKPVENTYYKVTSPMVGTFYSAPSPEAEAFASVGKAVTAGQALCIIEAMKLMNELEAEVSGTVRRILVENGQPVEYGQVIMEIEV
jgi:acetyl-CoA carboxylase biotin carboxyl carrier protein